MERLIIRLRWLERFSVDDIAHCLRITAEQVLAYDSQARDRLRRRLDPADLQALLPSPLEHVG
jgi:DNA-directed RNA polymerase specialized sigma24 family protein